MVNPGAAAAAGASMRPRHYCRGRHRGDVHDHAAERAASMRPRHYCRGRLTAQTR